MLVIYYYYNFAFYILSLLIHVMNNLLHFSNYFYCIFFIFIYWLFTYSKKLYTILSIMNTSCMSILKFNLKMRSVAIFFEFINYFIQSTYNEFHRLVKLAYNFIILNYMCKYIILSLIMNTWSLSLKHLFTLILNIL